MKLKPCPFCGGEAEIAVLMGTRYIDANHKRNCIIKPNTWLQSSMPIKKQIKAWNRREPIDEIVKQLERVKDEFSGGTLQEHYYWKGIDDAIEIVKSGGKV